MMELYEAIIYQPIYNLLVLLYDFLPVGGIGLAIIILTFIVKGILFPLNFKTMKSQRDMQAIQPKIKEIQEKFKDDKEKMAQELMSVYKENNVNPFASCLPLIVQLPVFIGLFRVLKNGLGAIDVDMLYSFTPNPGVIDAMFLGVDMASVSIPLAVMAAIAQYFQVKQTLGRRPVKEVRNKPGAKDENLQAQMSKMMLYFMPAITLVIGSTSLPGGVMLYWMATTVLTVVLYKIFLSEKKSKKSDVVDVEVK